MGSPTCKEPSYYLALPKERPVPQKEHTDSCQRSQPNMIIQSILRCLSTRATTNTERSKGTIANQENSGTVGEDNWDADGLVVTIALGLGLEAGKAGVAMTSGTLRFAK
jgi:hypothetical protein